MSLDSVLPARPGQICPCGAPAVYGLLWRQPSGARPLLRHALACARCAPPEAASWAPPAVALDPLPPENRSLADLPAPEPAGTARPHPADLPSSSGEGDPPAQEPSAESVAPAGASPPSTPEPQETPMPGTRLPPPIDPAAPPDRCRLQGCSRPANVRGICLSCYDRARRQGHLAEVALPPTPRGARYRGQRVGVPTTESAPTPPQARRARSTSRPEIAEALQAIWAALGSPSGLSPSEPLELLRATEERLRLDALLSSRIRELEEDGVRLRALLAASRVEGDAAAEELARALGTYGLPLLEVARRTAAILATAREVPARINVLRGALAEIVDRDLDGQTDADLIAAATSEIRRLREEEAVRLRARVEELEIVQAAATTARVRLAEILQEPTSTPWRQLLDQVEDLEGEATAAQLARTRALEERAGLIYSLLEALGGAPAAPRSQEDLVEDLVKEVRRLRASEERDPDSPSLSRGSVAFLAGFLGLPEGATSEEVLREILRLQAEAASADSAAAIRALSAAVLDPAQEWGGQPYTDDHATLPQAVALAVSTLGRAKGKIEDLQLSLAEATREVDNLRGALAACAGQDLTDQTAAGLIAAATSEIRRLREGWRWAAEDARQTAQALDRARAAPVVLTVEELKARAGWLQEAEKLRGWLVGDIAVSVCADGDWRDIGGDWLFTAVTAAIAARADELERRALEGVSRG